LKRGLVGRAELVEALAKADPASADAIAALLGFERRTETPSQPLPVRDQGLSHDSDQESTGSPEIESRPLAPVPFWRAARFTGRVAAADRPGPPFERPIWRNEPTELPVFEVLAPWREVQRTLRLLIGTDALIDDVDTDAVVEALSRGRQLDRLPREKRRQWGCDLQVVIDRSDRLIPFWDDQDLVASALGAIVPPHRFELAVVHEALDEPRLLGADAGPQAYRPPPPGGVVLVLGDLGALDHDHPGIRRLWRRLGHRLAAAGCSAAALLPSPLARCPDDLKRLWRVLPWERGAAAGPTDPAKLRCRADRLLRLVSPAVQIEPGFLRAVRRALGPGVADAGTEADVWQHGAVASRSPVAASLHPAAASVLRQHFADKDPAIKCPAIQQRVLSLLRRWRKGLPNEIWFEEVVNLDPRSRACLPHPNDFDDARAFFAFLESKRELRPNRAHAVKDWFGRVNARATPFAWQVPEFASAVYAARRDDPPFEPPAALDPIVLPPGPERLVELWQQGCELFRVDDGNGRPDAGSLLGVLRSRTDVILFAETGRPDAAVFWASGAAPGWAEDWGEDDHGPWAAFGVVAPDGTQVMQRLRWIPPGQFLMGSPEHEEGRYDDEGSRHKVTFARGFWMFDTPCTQALWEAVMENNPSRFKTPNRPVETVSFDDVQDFLARLNARVHGLDLSLPSEARWEYACRAGTETATYAGDMRIIEESNAPVLDSIAWYGGNSGAGFDLDDGEDSSGWLEKQYPHERAGTRPVALKTPNLWGLYDMLGNVWEWCADAWHTNYEGAPADGSAWADGRKGVARRVFRGGSWFYDARSVRAASRNSGGPADRVDNLGFRCVRVQAVSLAGDAAQAGGRSAERRPSQGPPGAARQLRPHTGEQLPRSGRFVVRSDCDELAFERIVAVERHPEHPPWASALGRDRFGLYTVLSVPAESNQEVIQRLRWIPPGHFLMGSPEEEEGRFDDEGPVHQVMIGEGFWLFDTPCTQALWEAVMENNPSQFETPNRPVENVTFDDAQDFLARLNARMPGLDLSLPSEAQWEYACRAGTQTATYAGPIQIVGKNNAPVLHEIAWYGGNSGVGFELDNGYDSRKWKEKQYSHERAGTRPVALKTPNLWGLYDMLGNVLEWCADEWHSNYEGAPTDGSVWIDAGHDSRDIKKGVASPVVRSGSWDSPAQSVRSAYRRVLGPASRYNDVGFRCARVQAVRAAGGEARQAGRGGPVKRSGQGAETRLPRRSSSAGPTKKKR
jgi:formylglycine-generating enzyme required for sulfatase activity